MGEQGCFFSFYKNILGKISNIFTFILLIMFKARYRCLKSTLESIHTSSLQCLHIQNENIQTYTFSKRCHSVQVPLTRALCCLVYSALDLEIFFFYASNRLTDCTNQSDKIIKQTKIKKGLFIVLLSSV